MSWTITPSTKVPVDPFRSQVSLLLHGDGTNGSTTITDSSPTPKIVTAVGNAQISTAVADPFNNYTGVLAVDSFGDGFQVPGSIDFQFGVSDFTIESWVYLNTSSTSKALIDFRTAQNTQLPFILIDSSGFVAYYANGAERIKYNSTLQFDRYYHIVVTRASGQTRLFVNGVQGGVTYNDTTNHGLPVSISIGSSFAFTFSLNGYIDDLRITKGVARYTSNFTPPTAPFPDI